MHGEVRRFGTMRHTIYFWLILCAKIIEIGHDVQNAVAKSLLPRFYRSKCTIGDKHCYYGFITSFK